MSNKKSLLRKEMESKRLELKKTLDKVEVELLQFQSCDFKNEEYQRFKSKKRLLIKEINGLTLAIKSIKDMEVDNTIIDEMDDTYKKLESGEITIDDLKKIKEEQMKSMDDDEYGDIVHFSEFKVPVSEDNESDDDNGTDMKNVSDEDIKSSIDDLLNNI